MTGKTQAARQPSIDDLLTSIRHAIHERVTPEASARSPVAEHARPAAVPQAAEADGAKRTIVTRGREGFAGLLGGDVRLEEALARLNQPVWRGAADAPVTARAANSQAAAPPARAPRFRPTIDDRSSGLAAPVAAPVAAPGQREEAAVSPGEPKPGVAEPKDGISKADRGPTDGRPVDRPERSAGAGAGAGQGASGGDLLSSQAASAANSAFTRLTDATAPRSPRAERPLDEMTRDCLRPLLKAWLDENLPGMVERLVREEIARVARRVS